MKYQLELGEEDRQLMLLALAKLKHERPGWDDAIERIEERLAPPAER